MSESELEVAGTGDAAKRIGQAPTTTDVTDPERSSRNTAAGSGGFFSRLRDRFSDL